jgi:hypothetical protein
MRTNWSLNLSPSVGLCVEVKHKTPPTPVLVTISSCRTRDCVSTRCVDVEGRGFYSPLVWQSVVVSLHFSQIQPVFYLISSFACFLLSRTCSHVPSQHLFYRQICYYSIVYCLESGPLRASDSIRTVQSDVSKVPSLQSLGQKEILKRDHVERYFVNFLNDKTLEK